MTNNINLPSWLSDFTKPYRYKVSHGGRGGGKTEGYGRLLVLMGYQKPLKIMCCRQFQNSIDESVKPTLEAIIYEYGLQNFYEITDKRINGLNGTTFKFRGLERNVMSIKGWNDIDICWIEEANTISAQAWELLRNTIRRPNSEIWISMNRHSEDDPIDATFLGKKVPTNSLVKKVLYKDNPYFPAVLEQERLDCLEYNPKRYDHIWLGEPDGSGEEAFIDAHIVAEARKREFQGIGVKTLGIDIGGDADAKNPDRTVWALRMGNDIKIVKNVKGINRDAILQRTADIIEQERPERVRIDITGIGHNIDRDLITLCNMRRIPVADVVGVNFGSAAMNSEKFVNVRIEMYNELRELLKIGSCDDSPEVQKDLTALALKYDKVGRWQLQSKKDIDFSPDNADAMALCCHKSQAFFSGVIA